MKKMCKHWYNLLRRSKNHRIKDKERSKKRERGNKYNFITVRNDNELNAIGVNKMGEMFVFADNLHAQLHK